MNRESIFRVKSYSKMWCIWSWIPSKNRPSIVLGNMISKRACALWPILLPKSLHFIPKNWFIDIYSIFWKFRQPHIPPILVTKMVKYFWRILFPTLSPFFQKNRLKKPECYRLVSTTVSDDTTNLGNVSWIIYFKTKYHESKCTRESTYTIIEMEN